MIMVFKKEYSYKELAERMKGRIPLPVNPYAYNFMTFPHWALVTALHYQRPISEEDLEHNLELIEMLPMDRVYEVRIHDLRELGVVV